MTGYEPDRDVIARMPRWERIAVNVFGVVLVAAAFMTVLCALDVALVHIGSRG